MVTLPATVALSHILKQALLSNHGKNVATNRQPHEQNGSTTCYHMSPQ